ncbi:hypothetical protein NiCM35_11400 [Niallia circulans]|uniref:hypothetical protein n=1 Tax=Niallia circulans TaxID=1397 RepID=UPI003D953C55
MIIGKNFEDKFELSYGKNAAIFFLAASITRINGFDAFFICLKLFSQYPTRTTNKSMLSYLNRRQGGTVSDEKGRKKNLF